MSTTIPNAIEHTQEPHDTTGNMMSSASHRPAVVSDDSTPIDDLKPKLPTDSNPGSSNTADLASQTPRYVSAFELLPRRPYVPGDTPPPSPPLVQQWRHLYNDEGTESYIAEGELDSMDIAVRRYSLISPLPSRSWDDYLEERETAERAFHWVLGRPAYPYTDRHDVLVDQIRYLVHSACALSDLDALEWMVLADGMTIVRCIASEYAEYNDTLKEQEIYDHEMTEQLLDDIPDSMAFIDTLVRLYSPNSIRSVDVHLRYKYQPSPPNKKWSYTLAFRINPGPLFISDPQIFEDMRYDEEYRVSNDDPHPEDFTVISSGKWERSEAHLGDPDKWWLIKKDFALTLEDLTAIRDALFGSDDDIGPGDGGMKARFGPIETVKLLYASVGIALEVGTDDGPESTMDDDRLTTETQTMWYQVGGEPWLAREIRRVCGQPLKRDAEEIFVDDYVGYVMDFMESCAPVAAPLPKSTIPRELWDPAPFQCPPVQKQ